MNDHNETMEVYNKLLSIGKWFVVILIVGVIFSVGYFIIPFFHVLGNDNFPYREMFITTTTILITTSVLVGLVIKYFNNLIDIVYLIKYNKTK